MYIKKEEFLAPQKHILAMPDHYVAIGCHVKKATEAGGMVTEDADTGKFWIKAGTPYPANDGTAIGIVMNDYDVTLEDKNIAVIIHGFIQEENAKANSGVTIAATALAAMPMVKVLEKSVYA